MSRNTADIGQALVLLREGLGPFVEREVERLPGNQIEDFIKSNSQREVGDELRKTPIREWEVYVLLNLMQRLWREVFGNTLGRMEHSFVGEAQGWRNKWAHQQILTATDADVDRALDTTVRLLRAVKAETQAAEVARLWESRKAANAPPLGPSPFVPEQPPERKPTELPHKPPRLGEATIIEFSRRFSHAFPGLRGVQWLEDEYAIGQRLGVLLRQPLAYDEGHVAWWWRGHRNLQVESFEQVEGQHFLMDGYELNISRIAAVNIRDAAYYRKWLYVETDASDPTGLYPARENEASAVEELGYDWEEFGLVDGTLPVTRGEFDDGATLVDGNPVSIVGRAELRARYITPYNFLLAPKFSPINNHDFDGQLEDLLNAMLQGEDVFGRLCESIERLPLQHQ